MLRRKMSDRPVSDSPVSDRPVSVSPVSDRPVSDRASLMGQRIFLGAAALLSGGALLAFALILPWRTDPASLSVAAILASGYFASAFLSFLGHRWFARAARMTAWASLAGFGLLSFRITLWALHLRSLYGELGLAVGAGLVVVCLALSVFLVPFALHVLLVVPSAGRFRRATVKSVSLLLLVVGSGAALSAVSRPAFASSTDKGAKNDVASGSSDAGALSIKRVASVLERVSSQKQLTPFTDGLAGRRPIRCEQAIGTGNSWVVSFGSGRRLVRLCLQGNLEQRERELEAALRRRLTSQVVVLDVISEAGTLAAENSVLSALELRPGMDGVCLKGECFLPWQLTVRNEFNSYKPIPGVGDATFGVDVEGLAKRLQGKPGERLTRITSQTYQITAENEGTVRGREADKNAGSVGGEVRVRALTRMAPSSVELDATNLEEAARLAKGYIRAAQDDEGVFRYLLNPYTGKENASTLNLPRHAGTVLALCDLIEGEKVDDRALHRTISRGLDALHANYSDVQGKGVFVLSKSQKESSVRLGYVALPALALLECEKRGFSVSEKQHEQLLSFLIKMQRPDGSFFQRFDLNRAEPVGEEQREALYASGQAVYALVLLETYYRARSDKTRAREAELATERAMNYYSGAYWQSSLSNFFYLEENWHCLSAKAALSTHRHDAYERFCLDYVTFKARLLEGENSKLGQAGGYTASPLFPPHSAPTAGFAEAASAALTLAKARGQRSPLIEDALRRSLAFLLKIQLKEDTCFACRGRKGIGGFPESAAAPTVRIDFVQHSLSGLVHGSRVLGITRPS